VDRIHQVWRKYQKNGVDFWSVYIDEAHPKDGWHLDVNALDADNCPMRPRTMGQRIAVAQTFVAKTKHNGFPVLVDTMENKVNLAFGAWPERLYVLNKGKVVYQGGPGPFQYDIDELEQFLENALRG